MAMVHKDDKPVGYVPVDLSRAQATRRVEAMCQICGFLIDPGNDGATVCAQCRANLREKAESFAATAGEAEDLFNGYMAKYRANKYMTLRGIK